MRIRTHAVVIDLLQEQNSRPQSYQHRDHSGQPRRVPAIAHNGRDDHGLRSGAMQVNPAAARGDELRYIWIADRDLDTKAVDSRRPRKAGRDPARQVPMLDRITQLLTPPRTAAY